MNQNNFGNIPYKACDYGTISCSYEYTFSEIDEINLLRKLLVSFKNGDFSERLKLGEMVDSSNKDVRQYCHQLLAHVCNHELVDCFRRILNIELDIDEVQRVIVRLGETLSLNAIPIILDIIDEFDDPELYSFASMALDNILPWQFIDDEDFFMSEKKYTYMLAASQLDMQYYYYRGHPVFIGDVAKELINSAAVSFKENKPAILIRQASLLSNYSGIQCPISNSTIVGNKEMSATLSYVKEIAKANNWNKGVKYFFKHEVY